MDRKPRLERLLEKGESFGFRTPTGDDDYLGWIMLRKRYSSERVIEAMGADHPDIGDAKESLTKPYVISILELRRDVHESDDYELNEDYRVNTRIRFGSLDDVEIYLRSLGYELQEIKSSFDIDSP